MKSVPTPAPDVPFPVVTVTATLPGVPAGIVAMTLPVDAEYETAVADCDPKWTAVTPARSDPLMVTVPPPNSDPLLGDTDKMDGQPPVGWRPEMRREAIGVPRPEAMS